MRRFNYFLSVLLFPVFFVGLSIDADRVLAETSRIAQLEKSVQLAFSIIENEELSLPENADLRRDKLREALYGNFDFVEMSKKSVGRKWSKFSPAQQERFVTLFKQLLELKFLGLIERLKGGSVVFTNEIQKSKNIVRIESIITSKGQKYDVAYMMKKSGDKWMVYNISGEGFSVISNYRAQFRQLLQKRNPDIEGMLSKLEEKISSLD
ncbi:MAG: ABC transporter substrate-binding protein [Magnetococcales bacterium]|nr:ABC transporter substrate-binding protein [Magnetococcales bacterium]